MSSSSFLSGSLFSTRLTFTLKMSVCQDDPVLLRDKILQIRGTALGAEDYPVGIGNTELERIRKCLAYRHNILGFKNFREIASGR